jgi:hypothetical protein
MSEVTETDARSNLKDTMQAYHQDPTCLDESSNSTADITINTAIEVGETLTGTHLCSDPEDNDPVSLSFQWWRADNAAGLNEAQINSADTDNYTVADADEDKYLKFVVIPQDPFGTGSPASSIYIGPAGPANIPPIASNCNITGTKDRDGNANTHFIYTASYSYTDTHSEAEASSDIVFYLSDDTTLDVGDSAVFSRSGALASTPIVYKADQATYDHAGKYLIMQVTPKAVTGPSPGAPCISSAFGPFTDDNTVTVVGEIDIKEEVDQYSIHMASTGDLTIDVLSYEEGGSHASQPDLGFGNGSYNDLLKGNIYLFRQSNSTIVDSRDGTSICSSCSACHVGGYKDNPGPGYPGCDAPDAFTLRSPMNPYMGPLNSPSLISLSADDYTLLIGAQYLDQNDANNCIIDPQTCSNNGGANITGWNDPSGGSFNNYKIIFTFNP